VRRGRNLPVQPKKKETGSVRGRDLRFGLVGQPVWFGTMDRSWFDLNGYGTNQDAYHVINDGLSIEDFEGRDLAGFLAKLMMGIWETLRLF
jgi:hypothetical protein